MRRKRAFTRGRAFSILAAAGIGYLLGNWNATAVRSTDASAAQMVALRFPTDWNNASNPQAAEGQTVPTNPTMVQLALLDPNPMIPQAIAQPSVTERADLMPAAAAPRPPMPASVQAAPDRRPTVRAARPTAVAVQRPANHPGLMLDDAQIASIKTRLHLTPDQEDMWPAVEAALRNIAYARAHEAHRSGVQAGAIDPNSTAVQNLKSAAIPLIMSFDSEQRDEVRSLAHVMGLDQLASQF
jgi:hypothetical protein